MCFMAYRGSGSGEGSSIGGARATRLPVSGVNANLRLIPCDPGGYRVVVTFHHADGSLCEAELKPFDAAGLMSEIARVIDQGNRRGLHSPSGT